MKTTDRIDLQTRLEAAQADVNRLRAKYQDRTETEAHKPFFILATITTYLSQFLSVVLGIGIAVLLATKFQNAQFAAYGIGVLLLIFVELAKRMTIDKVNEIRIVNKSKQVAISNLPYLSAGIIFTAMSMSFGYFGSPYIIERYSTHEVLIDTAQIKADYSLLISHEVQTLEQVKKTAKNKARETHEQNNWKGRTARDARSTKLAFERQALSAQDSITAIKSKLTALMHSDIQKANAKNEAIIKAHKDWSHSFGWLASVIAIILDLVLVVLCRWISEYENKRIMEANAGYLSISESKERKKERKEQKADSQDSFSFPKQVVPSMQIKHGERNEGDIVKENGKEYIFLEMKKGVNKGKLVKRDKRYLKNLINSQSNGERVKELTDLLKNFD